MEDKKLKYNKLKAFFYPKNQIWQIKNLDSPMHYNIANILINNHYFPTNSPNKIKFSDKNMQLNEIEAQLFEHKHQLNQLANFMSFDFMPKTYELNIRNYEDIIKKFKIKNNQKYILKPSMSNNAEDIFLFNSLQETKDHLKKSKLQGPLVLQEYINNPHLINDRKYTLRFFVILSNFKPAYKYKIGYYNLCINKYNKNAKFNESNISSHLTNEHLKINNNIKNINQICTTKYPDQKLLDKIIIKQADLIIDKTLKGMETINPGFLIKKDQEPEKFDIFGYDFLLDSENKLWLLEINHRPCFPIDNNHELSTPLFNQFWDDIYKKYVIPIIYS